MEFRLHHIGYLVRDISSAAAQWCGRFGYKIESEVVEDHQQTAFVQFLRLKGADHWLELVSPSSDGSKLSKALQKGEGLHHLCYEVASISLVAESLRSRGMLPVSRVVPATAFGGRNIAWFMDKSKALIELVEAGDGPLLGAQLQFPQNL